MLKLRSKDKQELNDKVSINDNNKNNCETNKKLRVRHETNPILKFDNSDKIDSSIIEHAKRNSMLTSSPVSKKKLYKLCNKKRKKGRLKICSSEDKIRLHKKPKMNKSRSKKCTESNDNMAKTTFSIKDINSTNVKRLSQEEMNFKINKKK